MVSAHEKALQAAREANLARGGVDPVPQTLVDNPLWLRAELAVLRKVVGPIRRRRRREPLPPPLSGTETARRLFALPVSYWSYDWEPGVRHLGPMSQDFAATFGLGRFTRRIDMVDANGVAVVAIQSLHRTVTRLEGEVERLRGRVEELENVGVTPSDVSGSGRTRTAGDSSLESPGDVPGTQREVGAMKENPTPEIEDDVEGHRIYAKSDQSIKDHVEPVVWDDQDDVEGHKIYRNSDQSIKDHVEPVVWDDRDDPDATI